MSHKPIRFVKKITAAILFGAFLSFGCVDAYALTLVKEEEEAQLPTPDYDAQVAALKETFIGLYWNLWDKRKMSERLYGCATMAVKNYSGLFTAWANEKDYVEAQKNLNDRLMGFFNPLVRDLQEQFGALYSAQVVMYYWELLEETFEKSDNPAIMAKLKAGSDKFSKDPALRQEFASGTKKDDSSLFDTIDDIVGFPDDVKTYNNIIKGASKKIIGEEIDLLKWSLNKLGRSVVASLVEEITALGAAIVADPVVGVPWAVYRMARKLYKRGKSIVTVANGPEDMRNKLYDPVHRYYLYVMPEELWKQMEKPIYASLQKVFAQTIFGDADAK